MITLILCSQTNVCSYKTRNHVSNKVSKKAKIRNRYNQVPHLAQDTTWKSDKNTRKHHIHESQEASPFPAGDHKAAMIRQESITNTHNINNIKDPQKKHRLGTVSRIFLLEGLN